MKHALMHVHRCTQWCCSFLSISLRILLKIHSFFSWQFSYVSFFSKFNDQISSVFSVISPSKSMPHHGFAVATDSLICFMTIRCWYEIQYFPRKPLQFYTHIFRFRTRACVDQCFFRFFSVDAIINIFFFSTCSIFPVSLLVSFSKYSEAISAHHLFLTYFFSVFNSILTKFQSLNVFFDSNVFH